MRTDHRGGWYTCNVRAPIQQWPVHGDGSENGGGGNPTLNEMDRVQRNDMRARLARDVRRFKRNYIVT